MILIWNIFYMSTINIFIISDFEFILLIFACADLVDQFHLVNYYQYQFRYHVNMYGPSRIVHRYSTFSLLSNLFVNHFVTPL